MAIVKTKSNRPRAFRRCGVAHRPEWTEWPEGQFTADQIKVLRAEPMIQVKVIEAEPAPAEPAPEAPVDDPPPAEPEDPKPAKKGGKK